VPSVFFINRVYLPDDGATGQLLAELAEALAREGRRVTILTSGSPSTQDSRSSSIVVHRVRGLPFTRASFWKRALSYASLYPALLWRALRLPRHDVIVTLTDPPMLLMLGPLLKFWKRARLVHWAQDVYPEVAEELGVLRRNGLMARMLRTLSTWSLRRHDEIVVVGRCMKERLCARGIEESKISVIPNWAVGISVPQRSTLNAQTPFTVMYSGNFGLAHPFEAIIEAVKLVEVASAPVRFVFAGAGPRWGSVQTALASCANVEFRAPVPLDDLPAALATADVHLACMSEALLGLVVPSKIYGALAVGRPCIFLGPCDSEAARIISESKCGLILNPRTGGTELAAVLQRWANHDSEYFVLRSACAALPYRGGVPLSDFLGVLPPSLR
jgi:colanic acid biosynthesis glycosyl transferase WcaI